MLYQIKQYFSDVGQNACKLWLPEFIIKTGVWGYILLVLFLFCLFVNLFFYMAGDFKFLNKILKLSESLEE